MDRQSPYRVPDGFVFIALIQVLLYFAGDLFVEFQRVTYTVVVYAVLCKIRCNSHKPCFPVCFALENRSHGYELDHRLL